MAIHQYSEQSSPRSCLRNCHPSYRTKCNKRESFPSSPARHGTRFRCYLEIGCCLDVHPYSLIHPCLRTNDEQSCSDWRVRTCLARVQSQSHLEERPLSLR